MATRLGVDIGGTFTDIVYYDDSTGLVRAGKVPSTPDDPETGVIAAIEAVLPQQALSDCRYFLHASTIGLNTLLTRTGAVVGLLATEGFRDILEIRRGDRTSMNDLFWRPPEPLVPRHLRFPIRERMTANGDIEQPLVLEDVARAVASCERSGATAIAVAFVNAYVDPAHEILAQEVAQESGFEGPIVLSHRLSREYREYERTSTTVIEAYVRGRSLGYLDRLEDRLNEQGFRGEILLTRCGGGAMSIDAARDRIFETITSGPVAGTEGAAELARRLDLTRVITADVGGTSFDTALIVSGKAGLNYEGEVIGHPLQTSWVDVRSIGAGAGSIATVDVGGLLQVGPESAGSVPGPACYDRGGTAATLTDAAVALGMFGREELAGQVVLRKDLADSALQRLAEAIELDAGAVARGIVTVGAGSMAAAIRSITVERGEDPRDAALMTFGGAGPLLSTLIARELEIATIVVPPYAGNFSAWGLLGADLLSTASRTLLRPLNATTMTEIDALLAELFEGLVPPGMSDHKREVVLDLRYAGQEHSISVPFGVSEDSRVLADIMSVNDAFRDHYLRTYGHVMEDVGLEVVAVRVGVRRPLPRRLEQFDPSATVPESHTVDAWSFAANGWRSFSVYDRGELPAGYRVRGPAVVCEQTSTLYLDSDFSLTVHESGSLFLSAEGQGK